MFAQRRLCKPNRVGNQANFVQRLLCKSVYSGFDGFVLVILESLTNDY